METINTFLTKTCYEAIIRAFGIEYTDIDPQVHEAEPQHGDYQCNAALSLARRLNEPPREVARQIVEQLNSYAEVVRQSAYLELFYPPEVKGPGFINIRLHEALIENELLKLSEDENLGIEPSKHRKRVVVDYSSPNVAKTMHIGHLRSTIIGDAIANVLSIQGHEVLRINHVGDWGTPIGIILATLKTIPKEERHRFTQGMSEGMASMWYRLGRELYDESEAFQAKAREETRLLQEGDPECLAIWHELMRVTRLENQRVYDLLGVHLEERGESFYNPHLKGVVDELLHLGLLVEDQEALCAYLEGFTNREGEPLPLIVRKADGGYNYATTDLAALKYRIHIQKANKILYVTDHGQATHFQQVFALARKAGWVPEGIKLIHIPFGLVQGEDGKRMRSRSGETKDLWARLHDFIAYSYGAQMQRWEDDIDPTQEWNGEEYEAKEKEFDAISKVQGIGAVKYEDLRRNRRSNYSYKPEEMFNTNGNTVVFIQYVYTRIRSVLRKAQGLGTSIDANGFKLREPLEIELAKHIIKFPGVVEQVSAHYEPHRLCDYLFQLGQVFNRFYEGLPIVDSGEAIYTRLTLCETSARIIHTGLGLLGIQTLERM